MRNKLEVLTTKVDTAMLGIQAFDPTVRFGQPAIFRGDTYRFTVETLLTVNQLMYIKYVGNAKPAGTSEQTGVI